MDAGLFARGLAIGFAVAFALGPIGLLVIRRTIDRGWVHGLVSGTGVATADAAYAAVAAFGLTAVTQALIGIDRLLGLAGGAVLVVLAVRGLGAARSDSPAVPADPDPPGPVAGPAASRSPLPGTARSGGAIAAWGSMAGLTLANPATILSFAALFASIGAGTGGPVGAGSVVAGVFAGSIAWWTILTGLVAGLRARLTPAVVRGLNAVSALVVGAFGVTALAIAVRG
jgi:putative LysE/RhtB family amino acid efflux pump